MVEPATQYEDQQISGLIENVERRVALEPVPRKIVDRRKQNQPQKPKQNSRTIKIKEDPSKDCLHECNLQRQTAKLFIRSACAEQESAFTGIEAVDIGVGNIVPPVDDQAEWKC